MKIKLKFLTLTFISLFFSKLVFAETAPGFNSWDDVVKAADGGQVNVYMWGGSDAINGFVDDFYGVPLKEKYNIKVITALTINNQIDVEEYKNYTDVADIILFDGKGYEKSIGFDHELLNTVPESLNKMIAGNIKIEDIPKFKNKSFLIDLSGALENKEGKKDIEKINKLLNLSNL